MIGWTHVCISTLIIRRYGIEIWQQILKKAGFTECTEFEVQCYYDDSETMRIFRTAAGILGLSVDDMWEVYGEFLITYACETGWEKMLACMANNLQEFLDNLNSMHYFIDQIAFKSEMRGPTFQCESVGEGSLRLHYFSHRQGLFPIVKGLVRRTARLLFDMDVKVNVVERTQERRKSGMVEHVVFSLEPDDQHRSGTRLAYKFKRINRRSSGDAEACDSNLSLALNLRDFARIFPYHICFNKQMVVEHVGKHLCQEYGLADKKMLKVTELVQLIQPADIQQLTPKSIMTYLNTLFIFQLKHHCKRNEIEKDSSEAFQQPLCLKGQMMPINGGNSIIFLCSPHVTSVRDILNLKLFISDMPMHDATRDLVMLNQSRICQMELNKRLEETVRKLKGLAEELAKKKQQTEHLLYQFVPVEVADSLRLGKPIPPQEYAECTVMFADVPDFITINGNCKPSEVIDVIAKLFKQFDRLIQKLQCYKVLSLMDSYLVVSGAPNPSDCHAENMLNLAIGFVFSGRSIVVPGMNLPVRVRVGISCGPIVAGVVSHEKPRYCIFGQTVNIAKEIRSLSLPGRILLSNVVKTTVSKNQKSFFKFQQHQTVEVGNIKMLTHFLEKNEKLSVWEISDIEKEGKERKSPVRIEDRPTDSIDGYKELHSAEGAELWESAKNVVLRKQQMYADVGTQHKDQVIDAFRPGPSRTRRALTRLQSVKRKFRAAQSNDSGVSMSEPNDFVKKSGHRVCGLPVVRLIYPVAYCSGPTNVVETHHVSGPPNFGFLRISGSVSDLQSKKDRDRKSHEVHKASSQNYHHRLGAFRSSALGKIPSMPIDDEYERLVEHLHDCTSRYVSVELYVLQATKNSRPSLQGFAERDKRRPQKRRAEVLGEAAEAEQSIRYARWKLPIVKRKQLLSGPQMEHLQHRERGRKGHSRFLLRSLQQPRSLASSQSEGMDGYHSKGPPFRSPVGHVGKDSYFIRFLQS
ncbi:hypothetical protein RB195_002598 [Necator americanus]|uniref:guanylate cyclase n=1 Tax=Necator americanus TaxID=51031 RepID=A0ABR1DKI8_NECAM